MIVIDASATIEWLLTTRAGLKVFDRTVGEEVHAPHLLDIEVAQSMRRMVRKGILDTRRAWFALTDLADARIVRHAHYDFLPAVWSLRDNVSAYDAIYIALAEAQDASLITCDAKLAETRGHFARVEYIRQ